ncbi:MAG: Gfo/Idh/MocA family protein [Alphaproteobacteria bacterium]
MKIALVGIGKIAHDQHVPTLADSPDFELAATVSRSGTVEGVEAWTDLAAMLQARPDISMVSLCMPPAPRYAYAELALRAGRHVMLEKPPGATLAEVFALKELAERQDVSLFATWHSRMARCVAAAQAALAEKTVARGQITWKEDVRRWHPGQDWVFEAGGMGVFDPGINALSILTAVLPTPVHLQSAVLTTPSNRQTPIAAELQFSGGIRADFDWRQEGPQTWEIELHTSDGDRLLMFEGGNRAELNDAALEMAKLDEYPALYARMGELVRVNAADVDLAPMIHVSDAFSLGRHVASEPFHF